MMSMGLERLMGTMKMKLRKSFKGKKHLNYDEIEKCESMRIELRSRKAKKLIEETLKFADSPTKRSLSI